MSTAGKLETLRREYLDAAVARFDWWMSKCAESPIEQLLLATMLSGGWGRDDPHSSWSELHKAASLDAGTTAGPWLLRDWEGCECTALWQLPVEVGSRKYRLDLAFVGRDGTGAPVRIAVELDGHDFHERTREQAKRDKARDRALVTAGWVVLRYTGADVYANPEAVLDEIVTIANQRCDVGHDPQVVADRAASRQANR